MLAIAAPASRISPNPSRNFSVIGSRSTMPRSASVATSREAVALCTPSRRPSSVTPQLPGLGDQLERAEGAVDRLKVPTVCVSPHATVPRRRDLADATPVPRDLSTRSERLGCGGRTGCVDPRGRGRGGCPGLARRPRADLTMTEDRSRYWRAAEPEAGLRRDRRGRRRARSRHRLLPGREPRHHRRLRRGEGLARRRQHRAQHHDHPLELPVGRVRGDLRALPEALGRARGGALVRHAVLAARRAEPGARPGRRPVVEAPRRGEPPERGRRRMARRRPGEVVRADRERLARRALPGARRDPAAARGGRAARQDRVGIRDAARASSASTSWSTPR